MQEIQMNRLSNQMDGCDLSWIGWISYFLNSIRIDYQDTHNSHWNKQNQQQTKTGKSESIRELNEWMNRKRTKKNNEEMHRCTQTSLVSLFPNYLAIDFVTIVTPNAKIQKTVNNCSNFW